MPEVQKMDLAGIDQDRQDDCGQMSGLSRSLGARRLICMILIGAAYRESRIESNLEIQKTA